MKNKNINHKSSVFLPIITSGRLNDYANLTFCHVIEGNFFRKMFIVESWAPTMGLFRSKL